MLDIFLNILKFIHIMSGEFLDQIIQHLALRYIAVVIVDNLLFCK